MYLTQAIIADDPYMRRRVAACAAQEGCTEVGIYPDAWTNDWKQVWSAAPGWSEAWESALAGGVVDPGLDPAVITDGQILSQIQSMTPFIMVVDNKPLTIP